MPDISMCMNAACKLHETCYRFTATPSKWQSYSKFEDPEEENCFIPNKK